MLLLLLLLNVHDDDVHDDDVHDDDDDDDVHDDDDDVRMTNGCAC